MKPIADGRYALYTTDDGETSKTGELQVIDGTIHYADKQSQHMMSDMFPPGRIDDELNERFEKMLDHHHGYMHLEHVK